MRTVVRLKLDMATRVRDFSRAHPDANQSYTEAVTRLDGQVTRARTLLDQQYDGQLTAHAATGRRLQLRKSISEQPLHHLARIARAAARVVPELKGRFLLPSGTASDSVFRTTARSMATQAQTYQNVFVQYGMAENFLDELNAQLDAYDRLLEDGHAGTVTHVAARADLEQLVREVMETIQVIDAFNRYRFRDDAALLAGWSSARNVAWPAGEPAVAPPPAPPAGGAEKVA